MMLKTSKNETALRILEPSRQQRAASTNVEYPVVVIRFLLKHQHIDNAFLHEHRICANSGSCAVPGNILYGGEWVNEMTSKLRRRRVRKHQDSHDRELTGALCFVFAF